MNRDQKKQPNANRKPARHEDADRLKRAREEADGYGQPGVGRHKVGQLQAGQPEPGQPTAGHTDANQTPAGDEEQVRTTEEWGDLVSQRIEDAMRQGLFDNLSNRGKPLELNHNPFVPEDQQMATTLLHNNGLAPEWVSERSAILHEIRVLRKELQRDVGAMRRIWAEDASDAGRAHAMAWWTRTVERWNDHCTRLNDRILVHNLKLPVSHLEILQVQLERELTRSGADPAWRAS